ncbi:hypothetical protein [Sediminibacillus albus]|uniref:hypothetical protein n=1 Tax=Sediminibacillus albus TaxID=407036 RepID=UPI0011140630|nr:hypothetical protein [Sediminibacillus albus]
MAGAAIGENYTERTFVAPEFFVILLLWAIGACLAGISVHKDSKIILTALLLLTWAAIPLGFRLALYLIG